MPCDGRLTRMIYVPGDLFSVNPATARGVPGLFARNERVVRVRNRYRSLCVDPGGATIVGSMATVWHGVVNPPRTRNVREWRYDDQNIVLKRAMRWALPAGVDCGLVVSQRPCSVQPAWDATHPVRMGEAMSRN